MNFDIGPATSPALPIPPLANPQMSAPSEEFATLFDLGVMVAKPLPESAEASKPAEIISKVASPADPAVAFAKALVSAFTPEAEPEQDAERPTAIPNMSPAAPTVARPPARRVAILPPEPFEDATTEEHEINDSSDTSRDESPVVRALPSTPTAMQPLAKSAPIPAPAEISRDTIGGTAWKPAPVTLSITAKPSATPVPVRFQDSSLGPDAAGLPVEEASVTAQPQPVTTRPESSELLAPSLIEPEAVEAEIATARPASLSKIGPAPTQPRRIERVEVQPETETLSIIAVADHPTSMTIGKAVPAREARVAEMMVTIADGVANPVSATEMIVKPDPAATLSSEIRTINTPSTAIDPVIDRQLDLVRNERWLGDLAQDIAGTSDDNNRLSFRLMPQQLGRLDIDVSRSHHGLSLTIRTESDGAQSILTAAQPRLADELRAQGLKLADAQMFSGDASHSHQKAYVFRPDPMIEAFTPQSETVDAPDPGQDDGRYA